MQLNLGTDAASIQMTITVFMIGYAFSMLIAGPLSDSIGRKHVLFYGLILYFFATLMCAFTQSIHGLIIARFLQALGGCCGTVVTRVMVKDAYPETKQIQILAHMSSAMAICPLVIPILGGVLQTYLGWRSSFYFLSLFGFLLFIIGKKSLQETPSASQPFSLKQLLINYKMLLTHKHFLGYSLTIGFAWCIYFTFTLESPFIIQTFFKMSAVSFGAIFSLVVCGYLIGTSLTKRYANLIGWDKLILIATFLCLTGAMTMAICSSLLTLNWMLIAFPMIWIMSGVGIIIPCTQAAVMQPFPQIAGTASGLFFFIQMAFGAICGLIMQTFNNITPAPMIILMVIASMLLFISFFYFIWRSKG